MRFIILCSLFYSQLVFAGADYAREKKWADEITPGIVVGDVQYLEAKGHKFLALYTEAANARVGLVIVHGMGVHPEHGLISVLRGNLADQGYTTLSIQMPILAVEAREKAYLPLYPEATERIKSAVRYLQGKGYQKVAIVSHSLGSGMSRLYVEKHQDQLAGWVSLGIGGKTYTGITIPVLDVYGENDHPSAVANAKKRADSLKGNAGGKQVKVPNADHFYNHHEAVVVKAVKDFLDTLK